MSPQIIKRLPRNRPLLKKRPALHEELGMSEEQLESLTSEEIASELDTCNPRVQCLMATVLEREGDIERSRRWYTIASENGEPDAQVRMGNMYLNGEGVPADPEKARELFIDAMVQRSAAAARMLSVMTFQRLIPNSTDEEALMLLGLAAKWGDPEALFQVGSGLFREGDIENGLEFLKRSADLGFPAAKGAYGLSIIIGKVTQRTIEEGIALLESSADEGCTCAMSQLALLIMSGVITGKDPEEAFHYAKLSAEVGESVVMGVFGRMLVTGYGCQPSPEAGANWLRRSVDLNYVRAAFWLNEAISEGLVEPDPGEEEELMAIIDEYNHLSENTETVDSSDLVRRAVI